MNKRKFESGLWHHRVPDFKNCFLFVLKTKEKRSKKGFWPKMTLGDLITQLERVSEGKIEPLTEDIDRDLRNSLAHGLFRLKGIFLICYRDLTLNETREIIIRDLWIKARTNSLISQCLIRLIAEWYITN